MKSGVHGRRADESCNMSVPLSLRIMQLLLRLDERQMKALLGVFRWSMGSGWNGEWRSHEGLNHGGASVWERWHICSGG